MKYYIIAGEASGDLHGSRLVRAIRANDSDAIIRAWGGDLMENEGAEIAKHYKELAFMGFTEVLLNIITILNNIKFCKKDIIAFKPDIVVFIDYPGFNLPMAKFAKAKGFKTAYYISPQIWAWKENRIHAIKKSIDLMMVILPFEKDFYLKWKYDVQYVGHPLMEIIHDFKQTTNTSEFRKSIKGESNKKIIAVLPGSRKQEIKVKLPIMLEASTCLQDSTFIVAQAPGVDDDFIYSITKQFPNTTIVKNQTYHLLSIADAALVTSGTATLETALFGVPEVVCYKTSSLSYALAKKIVKVKFISLVNLILNKEVVKELIQNDLQYSNICEELNKLLYNVSIRDQLHKDYQLLKDSLVSGGNASTNAALLIKEILDKS